MPKSMTSRERVLSAIRREPVDHVPCVTAFNPFKPVQRRNYTWQFPWPPDAPRSEQIRYQVEELGLDQVVAAGIDLCRPAPGIESRVWLENDILHKTYHTPCGDLHASIRYGNLWPHDRDIPFYSDFNIGHYVEPWIQTEADLACLKLIRQLCETDAVLNQAHASVASAKALADQYGLATLANIGTGLTGALQLFGVHELCIMTIEQPDLVDAYLAYEHQITLHTIEQLKDLSIDIVRRNGFYETADYYSPTMLEQFLGERLRKEAEAARAAGMVTSYTVHTGIMPILDYLAALPLDSLFGIDLAFKGVKPTEVRDRLAPTKSFWTGPSNSYHLWQSSDATRQAVQETFDVFGKTGLILSPCVSAHSILPWENTMAMIDTWRKLR